MRICTILGKGYEEIEAIGTLALLKRSGLEADLFGISGEKTTGKHDLPICGLLPLSGLNPENYDCLLLPGGPHYALLESSEDVKQIILKFKALDKPIVAICAAPTILGHLGLLKGKQYTCFTSMNEDFGGTYVDQYTVTDGNLITGRSAAATIDFAFAIIEKLQGTEQKEFIQKQIYY